MFERELSGGFYFYLYIQGIGGSSENNYDVRVGPPELNAGGCSTPCYVNQQYMNNSTDWRDGGARILAKRALPLNLGTGPSFPLAFTQINKNAAGQVLGIRHFDQDGNNGYGSAMQYQMQICGCTDLNNPACWSNIAQGAVGPNNDWACPSAQGDSGCPPASLLWIPSRSNISDTRAPPSTTSSSEVQASALHRGSASRQNPSYSGDTTVWEMPYIRPRLIK